MNALSTVARSPRRLTLWAAAALLGAAVGVVPTAAVAADCEDSGGASVQQVGLGSGSSAESGSTCDDGAAASGTLTWAPPKLDQPKTIKITNRTRTLKLDPQRDYVIDMPDTPVALKNGLVITGGHDVVLIGGEVETRKRGLFLKNQTGTVHVEGLRLSGKGAAEGINLDQRKGATVQLQNIAVETVNGSYSGTHADVLQTWGGPEVLRVDRLEGSTTYQGFFLDPHKFHDEDSPELFDIRNTVLRDAGRKSAYLLWQSGTFPIKTQDVVVVPNAKKPFPKQVLRTKNGQKSWAGVREGDKSTPSPLTGDPGTSYQSPGYAG